MSPYDLHKKFPIRYIVNLSAVILFVVAAALFAVPTGYCAGKATEKKIDPLRREQINDLACPLPCNPSRTGGENKAQHVSPE